MSVTESELEASIELTEIKLPGRYRRLQKAGPDLWSVTVDGPHEYTVNRMLCVFAMVGGNTFAFEEVAHAYSWFQYKSASSFRSAVYHWGDKGLFVVSVGEGEYGWEKHFAEYARCALLAEGDCVSIADIPKQHRGVVSRCVSAYRTIIREEKQQAKTPHPITELSDEQKQAVLNLRQHVRFPTPGNGRITADVQIMDDEDDVEELLDLLTQHGVLSEIGERPDGCAILSIAHDLYDEWCEHLTSNR